MSDSKFAPSLEYRLKEREVKKIRKDITTAQAIIRDGLAKYKKKMLHARSKKQAEDLSVFDCLKEYSTKSDIQDFYGYGILSDSEYERLCGLWDAREQYVSEQGKFCDRVTEMLEKAIDVCGDMHYYILADFEDMKTRYEADIIRITKENESNDYNRYIAGIRNDKK